MQLSDYTFVALDLETTGLSPETDTIIEVAAVKFHLRREGDTFEMIDTEERSMLIHPGRTMTEEISMITGITDTMLDGKPSWDSVREKIRAFIGSDSIIVGHNVLFDIAMFATHGINLSGHIALDTFELSEIFSRDAESLNLGFLGKKYAIPIESEHRALDDTKLSAALFCHYLSDISRMDERALRLWHHAISRDTLHITETLLDITTQRQHDISDYTLPNSEAHSREGAPREVRSENTPEYTLMNLSGNSSEEMAIIASLRQDKLPMLIITPEKKTARYEQSLLQDAGYRTHVFESISQFCSLDMLSYWLGMTTWTRKETILILKLASWLDETQTGLLDELKYYGEEREMIHLFRAEEDEQNPFFEIQKKYISDADIFLADTRLINTSKAPLLSGSHNLIIRDIMFMEDALRRSESRNISFEKLFFLGMELVEKGQDIAHEELIVGLSLMKDIYEGVPTRPTGPSIVAPGDFGETYFIEQKALWHRGYTWLKLASHKLSLCHTRLIAIETSDPIVKKYSKQLAQDIELLISVADFEAGNMSIIIHITATETKISLIPRDISEKLLEILQSECGIKNLILGYGIDQGETRRFLEQECGLSGEVEGTSSPQYATFSKERKIESHKTVILTTSTKHIRQIMQELKKDGSIGSIYGQGVSGGKSKMMSLFIKSERKSVLIGTIDSWIDESSLWKEVESVIIAKIPFDPPTDPYFLARTVGMKNNFEEYSTPVALATMNTLIGRIQRANPKIRLSIIDERIESTNWGQSMKTKLL